MTFFINTNNASWQPTFVSTFSQAVRRWTRDWQPHGEPLSRRPDGTLYNTDTAGARVACPGASAGAEFDTCTTYITSMFGAPQVWTAASPFGDVGFNAAAAERFFLNRGVQGGTIAPNDSSDPFNLPQWGPPENAPVETFNTAIDGAHTAGRWIILLLHSIAPTTSRWYATVEITAITGSITHAKSLGDVWIDTMANVGAYWRGQKVLVTVTPTTSGNTQTWTWTLPPHFPTGKYLRIKVDGGTPSQGGTPLTWDSHGYYEIALDAGSLTLCRNSRPS